MERFTQTLLPAILAYFDSIGPGEMFASFFDKGLRQQRSPLSPALWSSQVANRLLGGPPNAAQPPDPNANPTPTLLSTSSILDVLIVEPTPLPYSTPVGNPGVSTNLLTVGGLAVFPE